FAEDAAGNVTSQEHVYTGEVAYDDIFGRLSKFTEQVGADHEEFVTKFGYDDENRPTSLDYGAHGKSTLEYDGLGRVAKATVKAGSGTANTTTYTYVAGAALADVSGKTSTTGLVASISQTGGNFTYTYDDNGNITKVVQDGKTTSYTYDALGQLTRVDDAQENATWVYAYDQGGNILSKKKYALGVASGTAAESKTFTYGNANWRDQLTAVNGVGITYDAIGNPLNDGTWTYTWQNGRQLKKMQKSGETVEFIYNENGLRVQKTATSTGVTKYTLHGKNIVHMTQGSNELHFFYDAQNKPVVVVYNGTPYSYVKNLQGDIVAILDSNKNAVVNYVYDAWGRPISCSGTMANTLGKINPFRYRGYVYDEETGLYYLRSRYYHVAYSRFLNADIVLTLHLFAYCNNNPVVYGDSEGTITKEEKSDLPYLYYSYLTPEGCENLRTIFMEQVQFNLGYTVHPGQYVIIFFDESDPSGRGLAANGCYSAGLWAQKNNTDEYELISVFVRPQYLNDDLGSILFTHKYYTWKSDPVKLFEVMPHILRYNDKHAPESLPKTYDAAIKFFQEAHGLTPDGVVGKDTLQAIVEMLQEENPFYNGNDPSGYR
ncbi:MAG: peptidoglycan-binding protein, partial [Clostridiales bacterium]|nr:peptidoglycan-binding protein [Clostridiales bacterium]